MIVRDAEVIHPDGAFQYLVLDLLDGDIFAVDELEPVARAEIYRADPAAVGVVDRGLRRRQLVAERVVGVFDRGAGDGAQPDHVGVGVADGGIERVAGVQRLKLRRALCNSVQSVRYYPQIGSVFQNFGQWKDRFPQPL